MSKKLGSNIQKVGAGEDHKKEKEKTKHTQDTQTPTQKPTVCRRLIPKIKKTVSGQTLIPLEELLRDRWYIKADSDVWNDGDFYPLLADAGFWQIVAHGAGILAEGADGAGKPAVSAHEAGYMQGLIGHGGYGEIYYAIDVRSQEEVAIKVEPKKRKGRTVKRMILEQKVLLRLQGRPHIPKMIASGHDNRINFIVMQLLSVNVGDLKKASPVRRLGRSTVGRILQQAIAGLRDVHLGGYIHRDVKPANMCFGISPQTRHVLVLVDFGLVRRYKNMDGTVRPLRSRAGFSSLNNFFGLELLVGDLPWKYIMKGDDVKRAKLELQSGDPQTSFLALTCDSFQEFARAVLSLNTEEEPNYAALQALLTELVGDRKMSDPYDWETNYREAIEGVRVYPYGFQPKCRSRRRCHAVIEEAY